MFNITNADEFVTLCNVIPFDDTISLNEINRVDSIAVMFRARQLDQFKSAFNEWLRNSELDIDRDGNLISTFEKIEDDSPLSEFELVEDGNVFDIWDVNGYWRAFYMPMYKNNEFNSGLFLLAWDQNTHGFWTQPGVQIHRCLGQSLQVSIIRNCDD